MEKVLGEQIESIKQKLTTERVFNHPELDVVCLGGSTSVNSAGRLSDIDITTIMKPENSKRVDLDAILQLGMQIRRFAFEQSLGNIVAIVISSIRLEEAQVSMAELLNPGKTVVPIHWLHYPSPEFAAINEPPRLIEGLLGGNSIQGNTNDVLMRIKTINTKNFECLEGIDWLTDGFRVFIANVNDGEFPIQRQPDSFLKRLALHNLEYFWKWKIVGKIIESKTGNRPDNWSTMAQLSEVVPNNVWSLAMKVRQLRHKGEWVTTSDIIDVHKQTFSYLSDKS